MVVNCAQKDVANVIMRILALNVLILMIL